MLHVVQFELIVAKNIHIQYTQFYCFYVYPPILTQFAKKKFSDLVLPTLFQKIRVMPVPLQPQVTMVSFILVFSFKILITLYILLLILHHKLVIISISSFKAVTLKIIL